MQIDIEGNEWPVLEGMIKDKAPFMFTQMQVPPPASFKFYVKNCINAADHLQDHCRLPLLGSVRVS